MTNGWGSGDGGAWTFLDLVTLISFVVGLQNLGLNIDQNDLQSQTQDISKAADDLVTGALAEIHLHLQRQDEKIDRILMDVESIMISMEQINGEISKLEQETPTHEIMRKLASLYTVRDHMTLTGQAVPAQEITLSSGSEYARAIVSMSIDKVLKIMDDLMNTLQIVNPKLYDSVMRNLSE